MFPPLEDRGETVAVETQACPDCRRSNHNDAQGKRQPGGGQRSGRQAVGCTDAALAGTLQHRGGTHAGRAHRSLSPVEEGGGERQLCGRLVREWRIVTSRQLHRGLDHRGGWRVTSTRRERGPASHSKSRPASEPSSLRAGSVELRPPVTPWNWEDLHTQGLPERLGVARRRTSLGVASSLSPAKAGAP